MSPPSFSLNASPVDPPPTSRGVRSDGVVTRGNSGSGGSVGTGSGPVQRQDDDTARRGVLKSGPTYTPNGNITASNSGSRKSAFFRLNAEFEHDPANGIYASCCEVRQYLKWVGNCYPDHAGFRPRSSFADDTWYEDRDSTDKRYGHRSGSHSDPQSFDEYVDASGTRDMANGSIYRGSDSPGGPPSLLQDGTWYFRMDVIDVCNGGRVLGSDNVSITW